MSRTLVFTVALNHYDLIWDQNVLSHRAYAARHGYTYTLVRRPAATTVREAVWLKLALLQSALEAGWERILFVDVDCELKPSAPPVESALVPGKDVYFANGFSDRPNSGVILLRAGQGSRSFIQDVLAAADEEVPEQDWGENGHVIHFAAKSPAVEILDRRWNNNADPELADFIRHYSAGGPMRALYRMSLSGRLVSLAVRIQKKVWKLGGRHDVLAGTLGARLASLSARARGLYPVFVSAA